MTFFMACSLEIIKLEPSIASGKVRPDAIAQCEIRHIAENKTCLSNHSCFDVWENARARCVASAAARLKSRVRSGRGPIDRRSARTIKLRPSTPLQSVQAIRRFLESLGAAVRDTGYLCCIMTTDLLSPGISAWKIF